MATEQCSYSWCFRCSLCGELLNPDDVASHMAEEKLKPSWPGFMRLLRINLDPQGRPIINGED